MISTKGRYALRMLIDMAEHQSETYVTLREVASRQDISEKYLESITKRLVKGGILSAQRGKGGGYRLRLSPENVTVGQVLRLTEGPLLDPESTACPREAECRTLPLWKGMYELLNGYVDGITLASLMGGGEPGNSYVI